MRSAQTFRGGIQRKRIRGYAALLKQGETETRTERVRKGKGEKGREWGRRGKRVKERDRIEGERTSFAASYRTDSKKERRGQILSWSGWLRSFMRSWNSRNAERLINSTRPFVVVSTSLATRLSLVGYARDDRFHGDYVQPERAGKGLPLWTSDPATYAFLIKIARVEQVFPSSTLLSRGAFYRGERVADRKTSLRARNWNRYARTASDPYLEEPPKKFAPFAASREFGQSADKVHV